MTEQILKSHWERYHDHILLDVETAQQLVAADTKEQIAAATLLSDGCANSNYKITFQNGRNAVIRIYQREKSALAREVGIHKLVHAVIPVADYLYADESCAIYPHPYAITQWVDGTLMRELIFSNDTDAITAVMLEAGNILSILRAMKLPYGGFFQDDMQIRPFAPEEEYEFFIMNLLQDKIVAESLGKNLLQAVQQVASQCCHLLPEINDANLTHADYDPANILVKEVDGQWQIAAVLDWEFAFSGSYLMDIGLMLRYSHKLPDFYETGFIRGITENGAALPSDWKKQAKLLDLLCLLQLLHNNSASERPYMNRDVVRLINNTVQILPAL